MHIRSLIFPYNDTTTRTSHIHCILIKCKIKIIKNWTGSMECKWNVIYYIHCTVSHRKIRFILIGRDSDLHISGSFWLGGSDILVEGDWRWISNHRRFTYLAWAPGEPNNYQTGEHCLGLYDILNEAWTDGKCNFTLSFICEKDVYV